MNLMIQHDQLRKESQLRRKAREAQLSVKAAVGEDGDGGGGPLDVVQNWFRLSLKYILKTVSPCDLSHCALLLSHLHLFYCYNVGLELAYCLQTAIHAASFIVDDYMISPCRLTIGTSVLIIERAMTDQWGLWICYEMTSNPGVTILSRMGGHWPSVWEGRFEETFQLRYI